MYASFTKRLIAGLIDILIILLSEVLLIFVCLYVTLVLDITDVNASIINIITYVILYPICVAFPWLYYSLQAASSKKATIGKRLLGLIILDSSGNKLSFIKASARFFAQLLTLITFGVGFFISKFTKQKQALHDIMTNTFVIVKDSTKEYIEDKIDITA